VCISRFCLDYQLSFSGGPESMLRRRRRQGGQSIVEFGLIALTFTLLLFGVVDLGILLNGWLGVSASSRDLARQLAVGICPPVGTQGLVTPPAPCASGTGGVPNAPGATGLQIQGVDWTNANPVQVSVKVCSVDLATCGPTAPYTGNSLLKIYPNGSCDLINNPTACTSPTHPTPNDAISVTVVAQIEVVTPLVRPFFGCSGSQAHCDVSITSTAVSRYEGPFL
jgi:TadE-like protein